MSNNTTQSHTKGSKKIGNGSSRRITNTKSVVPANDFIQSRQQRTDASHKRGAEDTSQKSQLKIKEKVLASNAAPSFVSYFMGEYAFTEKDINRILRIDFPGSNTDNFTSYFIVSNCWYMVVKYNYSLTMALELRAYILSHGLLDTIRESASAADEFISSKFVDVTNRFFFEFCKDKDIPTVIQTLRFPKRFSPDNMETLDSKALESFISIENRNKMLSRRDCDDLWFFGAVRENFSKIFSKAIFMRIDPEGFFSSGSSLIDATISTNGSFSGRGYDVKTSKSPVLKIESCSDQSDIVPSLSSDPFKSYPVFTHDVKLGIHSSNERLYFSHVSFVPKSYKARRTIAIEHPIKAYRAQAMRSRLIGSLYKAYRFLDLSDQERNRDLCRIGSIDGSIVTIDLSSASDTNRWSLVASLLPGWLFPYINDARTRYVGYSGRINPMQMSFTSGNALTMIIQSAVYTSIVHAACDYFELFTGDSIDRSLISVYGDDIIAPTEVGELTCEFLEKLGFIVNCDKTYLDHDFRYRESCGVEYFEGQDLTQNYFPRALLNFKDKDPATVVALCELQHKLFPMIDARVFLNNIIKSLYPKITWSYPGSQFVDPWSLTDDPTIVTCSVDKTLYDPLKSSESAKRTRHTAIIDRGDRVSIDGYSNQTLQRYIYDLYLKEGPIYFDPLLHLLGCSSSRLEHFLKASGSKQILGYSFD